MVETQTQLKREDALWDVARYAVLAVLALIGGVIVVAQGKTGAGLVVLACAAVFLVVAVVRWRRGFL